MQTTIRRVILALLMALLPAGIARADETTTLLFTTNNAPTTPSNAQFMRPWAERINAAGKGAIKIDVRDGTVISDLSNYYDRVMSDVVQISWGMLNTVGGKFRFTALDVASLPFMARSSEEGSVALWRLYRSRCSTPNMPTSIRSCSSP